MHYKMSKSSHKLNDLVLAIMFILFIVWAFWANLDTENRLRQDLVEQIQVRKGLVLCVKNPAFWERTPFWRYKGDVVVKAIYIGQDNETHQAWVHSGLFSPDFRFDFDNGKHDCSN